jgi:hypothetical protein
MLFSPRDPYFSMASSDTQLTVGASAERLPPNAHQLYPLPDPSSRENVQEYLHGATAHLGLLKDDNWRCAVLACGT